MPSSSACHRNRYYLLHVAQRRTLHQHRCLPVAPGHRCARVAVTIVRVRAGVIDSLRVVSMCPRLPLYMLLDAALRSDEGYSGVTTAGGERIAAFDRCVGATLASVPELRGVAHATIVLHCVDLEPAPVVHGTAGTGATFHVPARLAY